MAKVECLLHACKGPSQTKSSQYQVRGCGFRTRGASPAFLNGQLLNGQSGNRQLLCRFSGTAPRAEQLVCQAHTRLVQQCLAPSSDNLAVTASHADSQGLCECGQPGCCGWEHPAAVQALAVAVACHLREESTSSEACALPAVLTQWLAMVWGARAR